MAEARATAIAAFDADTRDVIEKFDFDAQIGRLDGRVREQGTTN